MLHLSVHHPATSTFSQRFVPCVSGKPPELHGRPLGYMQIVFGCWGNGESRIPSLSPVAGINLVHLLHEPCIDVKVNFDCRYDFIIDSRRLIN